MENSTDVRTNGSFRRPRVEQYLIESAVQYFEENGDSYSWDMITDISEEHNVPKKEVRKALRVLRADGIVIHREPFTRRMGLK